MRPFRLLAANGSRLNKLLQKSWASSPLPSRFHLAQKACIHQITPQIIEPKKQLLLHFKTPHSKLFYALYILPTISFALGTWQIYRWNAKQVLKEHLNKSINQPPIELPDNLDETYLKQFNNQRITVKGQFLHNQEMYRGPKPRGPGIAGYQIITPFQRQSDG